MSMNDEEAVMAVHREFYRAFTTGDVQAMDALWARDMPLTCIHPGGPVLESRAVILDSWAAILAGPERPSIRAQKVKVFILGDTAFVTCYERLPRNCLAATNVFAREGDRWKLVLHQSSPGPTLAPGREDRPLVLH